MNDAELIERVARIMGWDIDDDGDAYEYSGKKDGKMYHAATVPTPRSRHVTPTLHSGGRDAIEDVLCKEHDARARWQSDIRQWAYDFGSICGVYSPSRERAAMLAMLSAKGEG